MAEKLKPGMAPDEDEDRDPFGANPRAVIGGNLPPDPLELIVEELTLRHVDIADRATRLVASLERAPAEITSEDEAGRVADAISQIAKTVKRIDARRDEALEPHEAAKRATSAFFRKIAEPLEDGKRRLNRLQDGWMQKKRDAARKANEEAAERARLAREEARRAAAEEAARTTTQVAVLPEQIPEPPKPEPSRLAIRGDYGGVSSSVTRWDFEIESLADVPLSALRPFISRAVFETLIRAYINAWKDTKPLKGVRIFKRDSTVTR